MTFIDLLTAWLEAFCKRDCLAKIAAEMFPYGIVCKYGKVQQLYSDRGAMFLSDLFREITFLPGLQANVHYREYAHGQHHSRAHAQDFRKPSDSVHNR